MSEGIGNNNKRRQNFNWMRNTLKATIYFLQKILHRKKSLILFVVVSYPPNALHKCNSFSLFEQESNLSLDPPVDWSFSSFLRNWSPQFSIKPKLDSLFSDSRRNSASNRCFISLAVSRGEVRSWFRTLVRYTKDAVLNLRRQYRSFTLKFWNWAVWGIGKWLRLEISSSCEAGKLYWWQNLINMGRFCSRLKNRQYRQMSWYWNDRNFWNTTSYRVSTYFCR